MEEAGAKAETGTKTKVFREHKNNGLLRHITFGCYHLCSFKTQPKVPSDYASAKPHTNSCACVCFNTGTHTGTDTHTNAYAYANAYTGNPCCGGKYGLKYSTA